MSNQENVNSDFSHQAMNAGIKVYRSSPIKRNRRLKSEIDTVKQAIVDLLDDDWPMTVRQVFYRLVSQGAIDKKESEYKGTVVRLLTEMRRSGDISFDKIADSTRWMRKPTVYDDVEEAICDTARFYRRDLWADRNCYVEVWLEKEALAGVLYDVTYEYHVPLMVTRGYPSLTYLHTAGEAIRDIGKPTFIYYFGDHDPSGADITRNVEAGIREYAGRDADIHFERVAVTKSQIEEYCLPTRPTKKTDTRAAGFEGESVEVDAIEPRELKRLCENCILRHIDADALARARHIESLERERMLQFARSFSGEDYNQ